MRTIKVTGRRASSSPLGRCARVRSLLLISQNGQVIRIAAESVRRTGRSTEGVRLMNLADDDAVVGVASVVEATDDVGDEDPPATVVVDDDG